MADTRFFPNTGPVTLRKVLELTGAVFAAGRTPDEARLFSDVAPLDRANQSEISFLDNAKYSDVFAGSKAGACFVRPRFSERAPADTIVLLSEDPYRCFAKIACQFYPSYKATGVISSHAYIAESAVLGDNCTVESGAVIGENVEIGAHCHIDYNAVIHPGVSIGEGTHIGACSTLSHCIIGKRVIIHRGVHIGQDGFGFAMAREGHLKVPQLGRVIVENDVEIGSGTCIDRGSGPDTFIGEGSKIDNLVQIGHNVHIGRQSVIVAQVGIAGSTRIGDGVVLGGQVGIAGHLKIGHGAKIAAQSGVMADIAPGTSNGGSPAVPIKDWHRQTVMLARLVNKKEQE